MGSGVWKLRSAGAAALGAGALMAAGSAAAASSITKDEIVSVSVAAGVTRTVSVPFPDALEYGNARYSGHAEIRARPIGASGLRPNIEKVRILAAGSVEGGSAYRVRARNNNRAGTAAVQLVVTATTVEPLPHS